MSMPAFVFENLQPLSETLPEGFYLVLLKTDKIPPHLGLVTGNSWFTLDVKGVTAGADADRLLQSLRRKNIASVFVQLAWPRGLHQEPVNQLLREIFTVYPALGDNAHTCLSPIRDVFAQIYNPELASCDFVFELLQYVADKKLIVQTFQLAHTEPRWEMPGYDMDAVRQGIAEAQIKNIV